ncbi:MAG: serpin family protein [Candidatus Lokiarchaeota archaeon]|nr:serpin family protein [Candidatus Lokiarchaeota archaeon]
MSYPSIPEEKKVALSFNKFGLDLYARLRSMSGNLFLSPFSISLALAMTYVGTRNNTASEMARALHLEMDAKALSRGIHAITDGLSVAEGQAGNEILLANALWLQADYPFFKEYIEWIEYYFRGTIFAVDYRSPSAVGQRINSWVDEQTRGLIREVVSPAMIPAFPETIMILTNAIYFKGKWVTKFHGERTNDQVFYRLNQGRVMVKMMNVEAEFSYAETSELQYIELPYLGRGIVMGIILPRERDGIGAIEAKLNVELVDDLVSRLMACKVDVYLPRFKMEYTVMLVALLRSLGIVEAFVKGKADFSGLTGSPGAYVSEVLHKAFVEVDEEGTKAAAVTAVMLAPGCAPGARPPPNPVFRADHPFIFCIKDTRSGTMLFMGRVMEPPSRPLPAGTGKSYDQVRDELARLFSRK